ncbi:hypothetical protein N7490_001879 [Penicillium lividum]|nr:hypothetical protein N7490_001879 [Penicillium lividum]
MLEERNLRSQTGNERQFESTPSVQMECDGVPASRKKQHGSRRHSEGSIKHDQESETGDDPSSGLHRRANSTKQSVERMK